MIIRIVVVLPGAVRADEAVDRAVGHVEDEVVDGAMTVPKRLVTLRISIAVMAPGSYRFDSL